MNTQTKTDDKLTPREIASCLTLAFSYLVVCLMVGMFAPVVKIELVSWLIFIVTVLLSNLIWLGIGGEFDDKKTKGAG